MQQMPNRVIRYDHPKRSECWGRPARHPTLRCVPRKDRIAPTIGVQDRASESTPGAVVEVFVEHRPLERFIELLALYLGGVG